MAWQFLSDTERREVTAELAELELVRDGSSSRAVLLNQAGLAHLRAALNHLANSSAHLFAGELVAVLESEDTLPGAPDVQALGALLRYVAQGLADTPESTRALCATLIGQYVLIDGMGQPPVGATPWRAVRRRVDTSPPPDRVIPLQRPPAATHFTGRAPELEALKAALQPGRVVTLYGPGGIGKTALAAEALRDMAPGDDPPARFPGGVFFHSFYGRPPVADCAAEIARAWGIDPRPDPFAAMSAALRGRAALLILDGAEEADQLDELLTRRDRCGVLITSRRRSDVKDVGIEVERLPLAEALALLWAVSHPAAPIPDSLSEGEGTDRSSPWEQLGEGEAARAICELVGNLPLALRLAGADMFQNGHSAAEYRGWLGHSPLAKLDFGARRRESVPVLLAKSVAQLSDAGRAALGVAGCLALAPFDAAPLAAALERDEAAARRALGELVNYELLRRAGDRYETTHALVHGYARERLSVAPEALRRLGAYYDTLARTEREKGLPGYQRLEPERGHTLAVLSRLTAAGEWEAANRLVWAVYKWLGIQGYQSDRIAALEVGLDAARALERKHDESSHLNELGNSYREMGRAIRAISYYEPSLLLAREIGNWSGIGTVLGNLGSAYRILGDGTRSIKYHEAALAVARELGDRQAEGHHLGNLANAYSDLGQTVGAIEFYEAALAIAREIGDRRDMARNLGNLGALYLKLEKVASAIECFKSALVITRDIGDRGGEGTHLGNLGNAYVTLGQPREAIKNYEAALAITRAIGDRRNEGAWLGNLGPAYAALGQTARALSQYEAALAIAREIGDRRMEGNNLSNLGLAYADLGQTARAIEMYEAALAIAREIGDRRGEGNQVGNLGNAYYDLADFESAIEYFEEALAIAREFGDRRDTERNLGNLGATYATLGQVERAILQYEEALVIAREIGDRQREGKHLYNRALALERLERQDEAIESMAAALAAYESIDAAQDATDAREELARLRQT